MVPCSEKSAAVCPSPLRTHFVVSSPSRPTGPRAWIRAVLIPTSAPRDTAKDRGRMTASQNCKHITCVEIELSEILTNEQNMTAIANYFTEKEATKDKRYCDKTTTYPVQSGSHQQNGSLRSRKHRHCPAAAGTAPPCPLRERDHLLVLLAHDFGLSGIKVCIYLYHH